MGQGIVIWLLTFLLTYLFIGSLTQRHGGINKRFLLILFLYHSLLAVAYYTYALTSPSDSRNYFYKASIKFLGDSWFDYFGISTAFIDFISFFMVNRLGLNYEGCMTVFAWFGYLGFVFFYLFFSERIKSVPKLFGYNAKYFLFLLPNLHFWSSSLGKGSLIFLGFGLFFFGLNKPGLRFWALLIGGWIIFQIRPHIFYVILIALGLAYTFSTRGVAFGYRVIILVIAGILLNVIYTDVIKLTGLEDDSMLDPLISHRARELTKATSGIDITNYSFPEKLFAFWFRPLFFDAPGMLGWIVSFENLFYLVFFTRLFQLRALAYLIRADALVKTCLLTFAGVSAALAQISGNLGLAMRQKSQVMILMLFVILKYMDERKIINLRRVIQHKKFTAERKQKLETTQP
ncbi:MAG: hypothetical protein L6Q51_14090 [Cyclobacteriaceae bacterium]|nr:hypothetical protein [Cyclobacteriaceae bacterium]